MSITKTGIEENANKSYIFCPNYSSNYQTIIGCYLYPKCEAEQQTTPYSEG